MIRTRGSEFAELSVERCCRALGVPRSLVYRHPKQGSDPGFVESATDLLVRFPCYGYRRVAAALGRSPKSVRTLMRRHGLSKQRRPARKRTTFASFVPPGANLLPGLTLLGPGRVFASDVTFVRLCARRWAYVAIVLDIFTRQVAGWAVSARNDTALTKEALNSMLMTRKLKSGWVHHSDRGSNYVAESFQKLVSSHHGISSFSDPASPTQNAFAESFFKTFKQEEAGREIYTDLDDLHTACKNYFQLYNANRLHSALGMKTPDQFFEESRKAS